MPITRDIFRATMEGGGSVTFIAPDTSNFETTWTTPAKISKVSVEGEGGVGNPGGEGIAGSLRQRSKYTI